MSDVFSIVAGGPSFLDVDHQKLPGMVVAVNDAILYLERPVDVGVSMDRQWFHHRWLDLRRNPPGIMLGRAQAIGQTPWKNTEWMRRFENSPADFLTDAFGRLDGANSGECAINYVYQQAHAGDVVYLFGFDMGKSAKGHGHWYPPYPWTIGAQSSPGDFLKWAGRMGKIAKMFEAKGIEVINVCPCSLITAFKVKDALQLGFEIRPGLKGL